MRMVCLLWSEPSGVLCVRWAQLPDFSLRAALRAWPGIWEKWLRFWVFVVALKLRLVIMSKGVK